MANNHIFGIRYAAPEIDASQDARSTSVSRSDGVTSLKFVRSVKTGDDKDVDLTSPVYLMFAVSGGDVDPKSGKLSKHKVTPEVSPEKVDVTKCK